jgi:hypothetical protein
MKAFGQIEALAGKHHGGPKGISAALRQWQVDTDIGSKKDAQASRRHGQGGVFVGLFLGSDREEVAGLRGGVR